MSAELWVGDTFIRIEKHIKTTKDLFFYEYGCADCGVTPRDAKWKIDGSFYAIKTTHEVVLIPQEEKMYDIIGDVHGCYGKLLDLIEKLGYKHRDGIVYHPDNRELIFVGDIVDRGPRNKDTFFFVKKLVDFGCAQMVMGNHDNKFARWLKGNPVKISHGLADTVAEFEGYHEAEKKKLSEWILDLPTKLELGDDLLVAHAAPGKKSRNLYGVTTGKNTPDGRPERLDWAKDYLGPRFCVYGHVIYEEPYINPFAAGIDTGCYDTGVLTAFRWPEKEVVQVHD